MYRTSTIIIYIFALEHIKAICQFEDVFIKGDYYVMGFFNMYINYNQSQLDENAVRFHLKMRYFVESEYYAYHAIDGISIGYLAFNICNQSSMVDSLTHPLLNRHFKPKSSIIKNTCSNYNCKACKCSAEYSSNVLAIFTYLPIEQTRILASIMATELIPLFAFSNQPLDLSVNKKSGFWNGSYTNKQIYSSYEIGLIDVLETVEKYDIKDLALLNIGDYTSSLAKFHQSALWDQVIAGGKLCVQRKNMESDVIAMKKYVEYIRNDTKLQLIVIWCRVKDIQPFIELTNGITDKIWFWYSDSSVVSSKFIKFKLDSKSMETHIFFKNPVYTYGYQENIQPYKNMSYFMSYGAFQDILLDKWISIYIQQKKLNMNDREIFKDFDNKTLIDHHYIESLVTMVRFAEPSYIISRYGLSKAWSYFDFFASMTHKNYVFKEEENVTRIDRSFENTNKLLRNLNHTNRCQIIKCYPGYEPIHETLYDTDAHMKRFDWHCVECPFNYIKNGYNADSCKRCDTQTKSTSNKTSCFDPYLEVYLDLDDIVVIVSLMFACCGALFTIGALVIFIKFSKTPVIRVSGSVSCTLQLHIHFVIFVVLPFCFLRKLSQVKCIIQPIIAGTLFTVTSTVTMTKTLKALQAFNSAVLLTKRSVLITKMVEWFLLFLLVTIQTVIYCISIFQILPNVDSIRDKELLLRESFCTNHIHLNIQLGFVFILCFFCLIQAFRGRNLPGRFNESKQTTYSMLATILILAITFPITQGQLRSKTRGLIVLISLTLINLITLLGMYSYRIFVVLFRPERNTRRQFQLSMMRNAEKIAARCVRSTEQQSSLK